MRIYVCHSRHFDYEIELYQPLLESALAGEHVLVFPHDKTPEHSTKEIIKGCDMLIAEVSLPGTGLGIQLGWANSAGKPIVCVNRSGAVVSNSLKYVSDTYLEYTDSADLVKQIVSYLETKKTA